MGTILTTGHAFGTTEQVTSAKLDSMVNDATFFMTSLPSSSGKIPPQNMWELKTVTTNASVPNIAQGTVFRLYHTTYCSIASFSNARAGQQFTLIAMQASFPAILDTGSFKLSAAWRPATANSNLTLIWDGSSFLEISRTSV